MSAPDITYTAYVSPSENEVEITITRDIRAGICGPWGSWTMEGTSSMADVAEGLRERGFVLAEDWNVKVNYEGLLLTAELVVQA